MDHYYDYEAQQPLPVSAQVKVSEITEKISNFVVRMFNIVKDISSEDSYDVNTSSIDIELIEVISK